MPTSVLDRLRRPFPAGQVKKNQDGLDYVAIDGYINRLLEVLGLDYNFVITQSSVVLLPEDMKTRTGKRQYLAQVTGRLEITAGPGNCAHRAGTGADVAFDPDKAVKTAQAEALKKAAHQFGIALELWDEEHRASLDVARRAGGGNEQALKKATFDIARKELGKAKPTVAEVAKFFGVKPGEMSDVDVLRRILEERGVL